MKMTINGRDISSHNYPYIIAELSANHNSDFERAKRIIFEAKQAGADAVKLQSYQAGKITLNSNRDEFLIKGIIPAHAARNDLQKVIPIAAYTVKIYHFGQFFDVVAKFFCPFF